MRISERESWRLDDSIENDSQRNVLLHNFKIKLLEWESNGTSKNMRNKGKGLGLVLHKTKTWSAKDYTVHNWCL